MTSILFPEIETAVRAFNHDNITTERKAVLWPLADFIQFKVSAQQSVRLNLICTHNSRRSLLSQVWAQAAAAYYGIPDVFCYSGGTEVTAVFPTVIETLKTSGFRVQVLSEGANPVYAVKYAENEHAVIAFSKTYDDGFNPHSEFAAVMTCSQADGGCPFIAGAEKRIPVTYDDPKVFDGTADDVDKYQERSLQIAAEMCYVFSQIKR